MSLVLDSIARSNKHFCLLDDPSFQDRPLPVKEACPAYPAEDLTSRAVNPIQIFCQADVLPWSLRIRSCYRNKDPTGHRP